MRIIIVKDQWKVKIIIVKDQWKVRVTLVKDDWKMRITRSLKGACCNTELRIYILLKFWRRWKDVGVDVQINEYRRCKPNLHHGYLQGFALYMSVLVHAWSHETIEEKVLLWYKLDTTQYYAPDFWPVGICRKRLMIMSNTPFSGIF